ncbi:MAG: hypothetical protein GC162_02235 [Planctomycetes bacterium]|nr:hypothetical protein [Planctomycetota bacterium]
MGAMLGACEPKKKPDDLPPISPQSLPALRQKFNARAAMIDQVWSRAIVELRWVDDKNKSHFEQGDGPLIIRKPDDLALAVGKLGNTLFWIGSNREQFWMFDLTGGNDQPHVAYVGKHADVGKPGMKAMPLPIHPRQLIELLGVTPIGDGDRMSVVDHRVVVERAGSRMILDAPSALPSHIELLDPAGEPIVSAELSAFAPLQKANIGPGGWPSIATRLLITLADRDASMSINLDSPTNGRARDQVHDAQFDFDQLVNALKPDRVEVLMPAHP